MRSCVRGRIVDSVKALWPLWLILGGTLGWGPMALVVLGFFLGYCAANGRAIVVSRTSDRTLERLDLRRNSRFRAHNRV